jgi:murein L,D-transpeptidase YcbB/YkuD
VRQLQLALERLRWLPRSFSRPPLVVNIPSFRLHALDEHYRARWETNVVVGKAYQHRTPMLAAEMRSVIFWPYWYVPASITRKELLPDIEQDPGYLRANDYEIVAPGGQGVEEGPVTESVLEQLRSGELRIRQRPGPKNALGLVKFVFPNPYDIYMHSTPAKGLFSRSRRDFSHGCIRVEHADELAAWCLRDKPGWELEHIRAVMNGTQTVRVDLDRPIPVLIVYGTAIVSADGEVHFYDDIYGYDAKLLQALAKGYPYTG